MIKLLLRQSTLIHRLQMFRDRFSEVSLYSMSGFDEVTTTSKFELPLPPPLANLYNDLTSFGFAYSKSNDSTYVHILGLCH